MKVIPIFPELTIKEFAQKYPLKLQILGDLINRELFVLEKSLIEENVKREKRKEQAA